MSLHLAHARRSRTCDLPRYLVRKSLCVNHFPLQLLLAVEIEGENLGVKLDDSGPVSHAKEADAELAALRVDGNLRLHIQGGS